MSSGPLRAGAAGGSGKWGFVFQNPDAQCKMLGAQCTSSALSVQELYPVREGAVVHRPRCFHEGGEDHGFHGLKRIRGATFNEQRVPSRRGTTSDGKFVLWVRRVYAMPSWIGVWIWLMVPVTAALESQGSGP